LGPAGSVDSSITANIPVDVSGEWFVLVRTDADATVQEGGAGENNNVAAQSISVTLAPYADLEVSGVAAPTLLIGDPATAEFSWTVTNRGTGPGLTDTWTDAIVASTDDVVGDADDRVLAHFVHTGALEPNESYGRTARRPSSSM
jgi:hypothetical protein